LPKKKKKENLKNYRGIFYAFPREPGLAYIPDVIMDRRWYSWP
jgi:hypothetical protein